MRFEGDHNESLIGDFESMKGCQGEYPIQSRLNKSNGSHETIRIDKKKLSSQLLNRTSHAKESVNQMNSTHQVTFDNFDIKAAAQIITSVNNTASTKNEDGKSTLIQQYMDYFSNPNSISRADGHTSP